MILIATYETVTGSFIQMHGNSEARTKKGMDVRVKRGHHPYFCTLFSRNDSISFAPGSCAVQDF